MPAPGHGAQVPCGYTPEKRAKLPNGEQPMKQSVDKPWDYAGDKRPQTGAQPINPYTGEKDGKGSDGWSSYSGGWWCPHYWGQLPLLAMPCRAVP